MRYDIHVHVARLSSTTHRQPDRRVHAFLQRLRITPSSDADAAFRDHLVTSAQMSDLDRFVLLAMDRAWSIDGLPDPHRTPIFAENAYVAGLARSSPKFLFGASVHPYRKDAMAELERVIGMGACLVKWIPSAQGIDPASPACTPFYEMLAAHRLPLLVHSGNEHTMSRTHNHLNDPALLVHALERGVTVIAAHCGARMFLHEPCHFAKFCRMAMDHEKLYGDLSAFGIPTRIPLLRKLQHRPAVLAKVLYGSDFPGHVMPRSMVFWISLRGVRELLQETNPLQRPRLLMRKLDLPDSIFTRAGEILRLASNDRDAA